MFPKQYNLTIPWNHVLVYYSNVKTLTLQDKDILILQCNIILIHMESTKQSITLSDFQLTTYHMSDQSRSFGEKSVLWYILFHKIWSAASTCLISKLFQHVSKKVKFSAHMKRRLKWGLMSFLQETQCYDLWDYICFSRI